MQQQIKPPQPALQINTQNFSSPFKSDFCTIIVEPLSAGNQVTHTASNSSLYAQQQVVPKLDFSKIAQQDIKQTKESFSNLQKLKAHHGSQGDMTVVKETTVKKKDQKLLAHISGAVSMNSKNSKARFQNQLKVDKFEAKDQEIDDIDGEEESIKHDSIEDLKAQSFSSHSGNLKAQSLSSHSGKKEQE